MNSQQQFYAKYAQILVNNNQMYKYLDILENSHKYTNDYIYYVYNMLLTVYNNSVVLSNTDKSNTNLVFVIKIANIIKDKARNIFLKLSAPKCKAIECFHCKDEKEITEIADILMNMHNIVL
jgi:hypothetical protein|uniref:Uncharacterized protein n=1 Tax=viral metagenome TaxID=1070528 RepID=A0A6C0D192_9ZZZZ